MARIPSPQQQFVYHIHAHTHFVFIMIKRVISFINVFMEERQRAMVKGVLYITTESMTAAMCIALFDACPWLTRT